MGFCRGSENRCRPRRRIILDRSPLELCFQSTEWVTATISDLRTLSADTAPSAISKLASLSLPPPATSLNLGTPTLPAVHTPAPTSFMNNYCRLGKLTTVAHIPSLRPTPLRMSTVGGLLSSHRRDGQGHRESKDVMIQRPKPKPKAESEWGEILGMGFRFVQGSGCESSFLFIVPLSFSSFWFSSNFHPAFMLALFIRSSLLSSFLSRNVRLKRTVCSHWQFISIRPVEVRG